MIDHRKANNNRKKSIERIRRGGERRERESMYVSKSGIKWEK